MRLPPLSVVVSPAKPLFDDVISICIRNLQKESPITVSALCSVKAKSFISCGQFMADSSGEVNTITTPSLGGTYTGVDPMGLMWSFVPAHGFNPFNRLLSLDVTAPYKVSLSVWHGKLGVEQFDGSGVATYRGAEMLGSFSLERRYLAEGVRRVPVREGRLRATLFVPPQASPTSPVPGILDMYGNAGGLLEHRAAMLASRGYVTLALAYMDYEDLPKMPGYLDLEYFEEALDFLRSRDFVKDKEIGAIGLSKGGNMSVAAACYLERVRPKCVVAINTHNKNLYTEYRYRGHTYPCVYPDKNSPRAVQPDGSIVLRAVQEDVPQDPQGPYVNPIEKASDTQFLLIHGVDDQVADVINQSKMVARLRQHNLYNFESHAYRGAGHFIEPAYHATCLGCYHKGFQKYVQYGGTRHLQAHAQQHSWKRILEFFRENLKS